MLVLPLQLEHKIMLELNIILCQIKVPTLFGYGLNQRSYFILRSHRD